MQSLNVSKEAQFTKLGLRALVINSHSLDTARRSSATNLWMLACAGVTVIILSPEQLTSKGFESLLQNDTFRRRICIMGLDEAHTIDTWGAAFRKSYKQVGVARFRMPSRVRLIATSSTIRAGLPKENIRKSLGLHAGEYYELHRSNVRRNVRPIFRILCSGLSGWSFPDLDWLVPDGRKTVIFARTIALGFRILVYLWNRIPAGASRMHHIRLYNALNWPAYNTHTRNLIEKDPQCKIIIATSTFMMGVDVPNIHRVVILGEPESSEEWLQWMGRAARGAGSGGGECITYISKNAIERAHGIIKDGARALPKKASASDKRSGQSAQMDEAMARIILAPCKVAEQDTLYDNPYSDPPCLCETCTMLAISDSSDPSLCACSGPGHRGCQPECSSSPPESEAESDSDVCDDIEGEGDHQPANLVPRAKRLTKVMRSLGMTRFREFRDSIYLADTSARTDFFTPNVLFPDPSMKLILDRFALSWTAEDLRDSLSGRTDLLPHVDSLWTVMQDLQVAFLALRKQSRAQKRADTSDNLPVHDTVEFYNSDPACECLVTSWNVKKEQYVFLLAIGYHN